MTFQPETVES